MIILSQRIRTWLMLSCSKGKKVLTSARARETGTVDPEMQILADEYREIKRRRDQQKSRYEQGEMSRDGVMRPRVTS